MSPGAAPFGRLLASRRPKNNCIWVTLIGDQTGSFCSGKRRKVSAGQGRFLATYRYRVDLGTSRSIAAFRALSPSILANCRAESVLRGRPSFRPCRLARWRPTCTRSPTLARSNSAIAPRRCDCGLVHLVRGVRCLPVVLRSTSWPLEGPGMTVHHARVLAVAVVIGLAALSAPIESAAHRRPVPDPSPSRRGRHG